VTADPRRSWLSRTKSFAAAFRDFIEEQLPGGRNAFGIYQQLVDQDGFTASYESVKRFVRTLRGSAQPQAHSVIATPLGEKPSRSRRWADGSPPGDHRAAGKSSS